MLEKVKSIVFHLSLVILGLLFSCIVLELLLALLSSRSNTIKLYATNPYRQKYLADATNWRDLLDISCCSLEPGSLLNGFVLNSHGFETPDVSYSKPKEIQRLVLIGDSQAVGYVPYMDNWPRLIERRINDELHQTFQLINLGVYGIGPAVEAKMLEVEGIKYEPDIVLVSFFVGNDYDDDAYYKQIHEQTRYQIPFWVYESKLFSFVRNSLKFGIIRQFLSLEDREINKDFGIYDGHIDGQTRDTFTKDFYLNLESQRAEIFVQGSRVYDNLDLIKNSILMMKAESEQIGAKFIVLIIPDEMQINPLLFSEIIQLNHWSSKDYDLQLPQKLLKEFFLDQNISFIDPLENWLEDPYSSEYFLPNNSHLNVRGNQSIANIVTPILLDSLKIK